MAVVSLAVVGKEREPLYLKEFEVAGSSSPSAVICEEETFLFGLSSTSPADQQSNATKLLGGFDCSARHQFLLHAALDRVEQLEGPTGWGWRKDQQQRSTGKGGASPKKPSASMGSDGMFMGLLCPFDELRVYGYMTTTKILFLLAVEDDSTPESQQRIDGDIKTLLKQVHQLFIEDTMNPFKTIGSALNATSGGSFSRFDTKVQQQVVDFNQSGGTMV